MPITAALVTGGFTIGSAFLQNWYTNQARSESKAEARRSEQMQIEFARKENERLQKQWKEEMEMRKEEFARTHGLQKQQFAFNKHQAQFQNTEQVVNRLVGMFDKNQSARRMLSNTFRGRRVA